MAPSLHRLTATALLLLGACAGAPARPPGAAPEAVAWPEPPAAPRIRLAAIHPDPAAPRPRRAWWKVALEILTGAEQREEDRLFLARPFGVALGDGGALFVADPDGPRVVRIDARGTLEDLRCGDAPWAAPMALALAEDGALLVADAGAGAVVRWTERGCSVLGAGLLERPTGVAATPQRIWVADPPSHQVLALSPTGEVVVRIGAQGQGDGRFHFPSAVAVAPDGTVLVVDALNFRVVRLSAEGRWLGAFGEAGEDGDGLARPKALAVGGDGTILVSDAQRDAVLAFAPDGALLWRAEATGEGAGRFAHPAGLSLREGRLAVADSHNHRIQVFDVLGGRP